MNTFMPLPSIHASVRSLDTQRLGNQVYCECKVLFGSGWGNHPVRRMWDCHMHELAGYAIAGLEELWNRGRKYPHHYKFFAEMQRFYTPNGMPSWFGDDAFHASHRSNLLRKDPVHYGQFGWSEPHNLPYVWPL